MIKLAANLSTMFTEIPFLDRFEAAAATGFSGVEYLFPYDQPADRIRAELERHGLQQVLFNTPVSDWAGGDRGMAGDPGRIAECRRGIDQAIDYAVALDCPRIHLMAGIRPAGIDLDSCMDTMVDNLRYAADLASPHGVAILVEAINSKIDIPGYLVDHSAQALTIVDRAGRDNIRLQYDIYHMQVMEGDLARTIERLANRIGHIQIADHPGRHEPGTGEINYPWLLRRIEALRYDGWIGCEYRPAGDTLTGLDWAHEWLRSERSAKEARHV